MKTRLSWNRMLVLTGIALMALTVGLLGQLSGNKSPYLAGNGEVVSFTDAGMADYSYIEDWMTLPFEKDLYERELNVESWMMIPFETGILEEDLNMESWMKVPFEVEEDTGIENWMTAVWI